MARKRRRLGEILVGWGVITQDKVDDALAHAQSEHLRIGEALVALGLADEEDVTKALASQYDMEYMDLERNVVVSTELELIPEDIVRKHLVVPIQRENGRLRIIITDPLDLETMDMLRFRLNMELDPVLASRGKMRAFIDNIYRSDKSLDDAVAQLESSIDSTIDKSIDADGEDLTEEAAPIVRLVNMLITEAVNMNASDIHIEPMANRVRVRYRIDGVCIERDNIPKRMQGPVLNRFKLLAGIDLAEKRLPTDGRIKMMISNRQVDFRVSALPAYHGESVVLRILRPESAKLGIQALGFEPNDYERFQRIIKRPNGIFLVTGPTGSGKTTTLYAAVNELNRPDRKIITAEEPVEYQFTGVNQCQVREEIGLTFERILRSMLRQAPNIILVGEIRDLVVAEVAIQAALTGHLVFSTLHTNDAPSAITRLIDIGIKPFLVASSIQAIMAQRLVRRICKECKEENPEPNMRTLRLLGYTDQELAGAKFFRGRGCNVCNGSGYKGRQGIFEMMEMNPAIRELAFNRSSISEVRKAARASGMRTLLEDGKEKIKNGITTPDELIRITQAAEVVEDV